jgi:hypothetical protein
MRAHSPFPIDRLNMVIIMETIANTESFDLQAIQHSDNDIVVIVVAT